jgi:hypothetical protein
MPQSRGEKNMKWLRIVMLVCALPAQADSFVIPNLKLAPQERSQWCWAAVSSIAISAFPQDTKFRHLKQVDVVARRRLELSDLSLATGLETQIEKQVTFCNKKITNCDGPEEPLLFDIDSDNPPGGNALKLSAFKQDIKTNRKPVIIRWMYSRNSRRSFATHALIVIGYDIEGKKLRVYDPLPLNRDSTGDHLTWISYDTYLKPSKHDGKTIIPVHEFEQYRMRRRGQPRPQGTYEMVAAPPVTERTDPPGGFEPPGKLQGVIDQYIKQEQAGSGFLDADGKRRRGNITAGTPIAVVAIGAEELNAPPERLLVRHAHAYVVPVFEGKQFVDSFQLLPENGGWQQGGYSSPGIASLLARLSEESRNRHDLRQGEVFYLVSVPELAAFFLAHGFGKEAKLKSLDYGGREEFMTASKAFEALKERARLIEAYRSAKSQPITTQ